MNDLYFKKASINDDLEKIAELIFYTDDYIYPYWFETVEKCKSELPRLMKEDKFYFNLDNIYIAVNSDNVVLGLICIVDKSTDLSYDYEPLKNINERYRFTIEHYIFGLIEEVKEADFAYISNICVDPKFRDLHVGTFLINHLLELYKKKKFEEIVLDVLAENPRAIHLYEKMGFRKSSDDFEGFSNPEEKKPTVFSMKTTL